MSRPSKGPRLWKRPARRRDGRIIAKAVWIIKDGDKHFATGCTASQANSSPPIEAQKALAHYIAQKYQPPRQQRDIDQIDIADVLSIYHSDTRDNQSSPLKFDGRISRLNEFFGGKMLGEISTKLTNDYVANRRNFGGARRDLEDLRAAINHHAAENHHHANIRIKLPPKGQPRTRWLTRSEAARILWACLQYREVQTIHVGALKGEKVITSKRPLRHIARFILIGLYTGTRAGAILTASPYQGEGKSFVDLESNRFYRLAEGQRASNKRQPPVPIPPRLAAHMQRWVNKKMIVSHFVEWDGSPIKSVKNGFARAIQVAALSQDGGRIVPHTLRHTAATWLMQRQTDPWQAAGFLGMSIKVLLDTYGHHHPDYMKQAASAITRNDRTKNVSVVKSVVELNQHREKSKIKQ